jgi:hypothetical protein
MRTLAFVGLLAMVFAWPLSARCQQSWQLHDPNDYTQEDSHPVRAIASLLSPIGWALEWGVARPWHYVATQTVLAPVLNGGQDEDSWSEYYDSQGGPVVEAPIAPPPAREPGASGPQALREQDLGYRPSAPPVSSTTRTYQTTPGAAQQAPAAAAQGQSVLH